MAVPKQKQSHARTSKRRAQHKITAPSVNACPQCHQPRRPHRVCPHCGSFNVEWFTASGDATLYSYVINHRPAPGFEDEAPYAIAVVQLAEGPRMMTSIRGVPATPEALVLDMPLRVAFEERGDVWLPVFTPEEEGR